MTAQQHWVPFAMTLVLLGASGCADRGDTFTNLNNPPAATSQPGDTQNNENRVSVTVTGCFQEMSGPKNFVLSNVGDAPEKSPSETRVYRIEQGGELQQYVGKKVNVTGWVDADVQAQGVAASRAKSGNVDFNDLPELHIDTITALGEACGATQQ